MITFFACLVILIAGYFFYGRYVERQINPDDRKTPAVEVNDGVDYIVMPRWKMFMIQLLNIAGLGPIFGALAGAMWGPSVFLWITFGTIFAGAVHDYVSGMISERHLGASLSEITGLYLGTGMKNAMRVITVFLLVMVGAVFAVGPAGLIVKLCEPKPAVEVSVEPVKEIQSDMLTNAAGGEGESGAAVTDGAGQETSVVPGVETVKSAEGNIEAANIAQKTEENAASTKTEPQKRLIDKTWFWVVVILIYYFIATFISIDKIIGKLYPLFGLALIIMAVGVTVGIFSHSEYHIPELWNNFRNMHPKNTPIWSIMFITVACGAISGFHATQSPLMARCMKSEKQGRGIFYGAMVCEGIIALVWAAAGCALYSVADGKMTGLADALKAGQAGAIYDVCSKTMGGIGVALAMLGVIACPISTGDTAFRSARLTLADWLKFDQKSWQKRLMLCVPLLVVGALITQLDYSVIWRYFSWTNQTLSVITLWACSIFLSRMKKNFWITAIPATFMTAVSVTYLFQAKECLNLSAAVSYVVGLVAAVGLFALFMVRRGSVK